MAIRITTVTSGTNDVETSSLDINNFNTDLLTAGVVGAITDDEPDTGAFAVTEQATPDGTVKVTAGSAYVTATPNGGVEQRFRVNLSANANVTPAANSTGSTVYDKILIVLDEDYLVNPPASNDWSSLTGSDAVLQTERHNAASEAVTADNAYEIAEITLANGFSTITDDLISDSREVVKSLLGTTRQNNTTNTEAGNQLIQTGWGFIQGDGANWILSEAVTFQDTFGSAPIVYITGLGSKASSDPTAIGDFNTRSAPTLCADDIATTGFTASLGSSDGASALSSTYRYGYAWIAIGTKA